LAERRRLSVRELALYALLGGLTFCAKLAMAGLPNIEPVTLLVMLYAVTFGRRAVWPIAVYVLMEFALFGLHLWSLCYLYIWAVPAVLAHRLRSMGHPLGWALLSAAFGLAFGALCAPVYLPFLGPAGTVSWWLAGIPFDLLHSGGNGLLALTLFCPLRRLLRRLAEPEGLC
jgi:energy-coupling factor transport system substrate-specific component